MSSCAPQIKYLVSYQHMGTALLECVESCTCEPLLIDGDTGGESFSGPRRVALPIAAFRTSCALRVTNTARTDGRPGTKFKLMGFYLKGNGLQGLASAEALHHRGRTQRTALNLKP
jgi:hypothetical protein